MEENIVDYLLDLLKTKGADIQYGNEDVTQGHILITILLSLIHI